MEDDSVIQKRVVDTSTYIDTIRAIVEEGHEVPLLITGNSMCPFLIHERDTILIRKPKMPLKKGDMAFYRRKNGQYVMHRVYRVRKSQKGENLYYMVGDAQQVIEGPIEENMIFGHIIKVCRKGKWTGSGDFWWEFFEHVWIRIVPLRKGLMRIYRFVKT